MLVSETRRFVVIKSHSGWAIEECKTGDNTFCLTTGARDMITQFAKMLGLTIYDIRPSPKPRVRKVSTK